MIKGQSKFEINNNLTIGQDKNGMHYAEIRDNDNVIETVLTALTPLSSLQDRIRGKRDAARIDKTRITVFIICLLYLQVQKDVEVFR